MGMIIPGRASSKAFSRRRLFFGKTGKLNRDEYNKTVRWNVVLGFEYWIPDQVGDDKGSKTVNGYGVLIV